MKPLALILFATLLCATPALTRQKTTALERLLQAETSRIPARVGVFAKNLATGEEASIRADEAFNSAGILKIPIMIMAFQQIEQGKLDLKERVTVRRSDVRVGTGVLQYHDPGEVLTLRDLITEMIINNDNTATGLVMQRLGGPEGINKWLKDRNDVTRTTWGAIDVTRRMFAQLDPAYARATDEEITALEYLRTGNPLFINYLDLFAGNRKQLADRVTANSAQLAEAIRQRPASDENYWTGSTTPREIGRFLESIELGTAASHEGCLEMKHILLRQQLGGRRIPHFLDVPVAHKTGDGAPGVANDAGLVYAHSGVIVISFFVMGNTGPYAETEDQIGHISREIVDYFDGNR